MVEDGECYDDCDGLEKSVRFVAVGVHSNLSSILEFLKSVKNILLTFSSYLKGQQSLVTQKQ